MLHRFLPPLTLVIFAFTACQETPSFDPSLPQFEIVDVVQSGVRFNNQITEDTRYNSILYDVIYNGGGVAVGDINNDGLIDVYFTGNQVSDALYLNKGNFEFEDISAAAGISKSNTWSSAVAMADVNSDGYLDIYVVKYLKPEPEARKNLLFINNRDNTFTEQAEAYGIADSGFGTSANFFDFDKDGDLDLYVANQFNSAAYYKKKDGNKVDYKYTDRLFRNDGQRFTDVTQEAGITNFGAALSATVGDLNNDGWPDIYVANDYDEPDLLYYNNGDGTFRYGTNSSFKHISNFSMGSDIGDVNNDGLLDVFTGDMSAEDNFRTKTNMSGMNPEKFWNLVSVGYNHQYMYNALQLNNGNGTFSDIAQLAGVSRTDWSWATLLEDLDLDGNRDLYITNGLYRDTRNNDYQKWLKKETDKTNKLLADGDKAAYQQKVLELSKMAPAEKVQNYAYRNMGNLAFENSSTNWNLGLKGWSRGAALGDFDNDGDPDLIVSNLNDVATIYRNNAAQKGANFVQVKSADLAADLGAKVKATMDDGSIVYAEINAVRGYQSQSEAAAYIGIAEGNSIQQLEIQWLDGAYQKITTPKERTTIVLDKSKAGAGSIAARAQMTTFSKLNTELGHKENTFDDYQREILIPHKMSQLGPTLAKGDVNGDGLQDLYIGGSAGMPGELHVHKANGDLDISTQPAFAADKASEDLDAVFLDIDEDGDLDLIVASGGNEYTAGDSRYKDRLYLNDGKGNYTKGSIEATTSSSGCIAVADIDSDGDLDVFVGGRQVPGLYGRDAASTLYVNEGGKLENRTTALAPLLEDIGMVTDAEWTDLDADGDVDLLLVGEWMPISMLINNEGKFEQKTLPNSSGWWNTIYQADVDGNGIMDFLVGNLGYNIKYKASVDKPFKLFAKDFDQSGSHDVYLGYYDKDGNCYPVRGRQCSSQQMPFIAEKYDDYATFAKAPIEDVLEGLTEDASIKQVQTFASVWLKNDGKGNLTMEELPIQAQIGPIFTFTPIQTADGKDYIFAGGNFHQREVETTRSDASTGLLLAYDTASATLVPIESKDSGIYADGDVRDSEVLPRPDGSKLLLVANNDAPLGVWYYK